MSSSIAYTFDSNTRKITNASDVDEIVYQEKPTISFALDAADIGGQAPRIGDIVSLLVENVRVASATIDTDVGGGVFSCSLELNTLLLQKYMQYEDAFTAVHANLVLWHPGTELPEMLISDSVLIYNNENKSCSLPLDVDFDYLDIPVGIYNGAIDKIKAEIATSTSMYVGTSTLISSDLASSMPINRIMMSSEGDILIKDSEGAVRKITTELFV